MSSNRILRGAALLGAASLIVGAFVAVPAQAKSTKPAAKACKAFKAKTDGKGQPTSVVTDKATADAPVEVTVPTAAGVGLSSPDGPSGDTPAGGATHTYYNVQVDSKAKMANLHVRLEYTPVLDYDLYLRSEGAALAYSAGFSVPVPAQGLDGTGFGGHTEVGSENIDGWPAPDCSGYTVDVVSATTPGVDVTLKFWLAK